MSTPGTISPLVELLRDASVVGVANALLATALTAIMPFRMWHQEAICIAREQRGDSKREVGFFESVRLHFVTMTYGLPLCRGLASEIPTRICLMTRRELRSFAALPAAELVGQIGARASALVDSFPVPKTIGQRGKKDKTERNNVDLGVQAKDDEDCRARNDIRRMLEPLLAATQAKASGDAKYRAEPTKAELADRVQRGLDELHAELRSDATRLVASSHIVAASVIGAWFTVPTFVNRGPPLSFAAMCAASAAIGLVLQAVVRFVFVRTRKAV